MASTAAARRLVGKLNPESSLLMVCDIQTKFRPLVWRGETVVRTAQYMTSVSKALNIPIVTTQQVIINYVKFYLSVFFLAGKKGKKI